MAHWLEAALFLLEEVGMRVQIPPWQLPVFFSFIVFLPFGFLLVILTADPFSFARFCENIFLVVFFVLLASFCVYEALGLDVCGIFTAFVAVMGHCAVRLARGSCFFMLCIGGCLRVWSIGAQASPSHEPLLSKHSARRPLRLGVGAHGWRARVCQPWGHNSV